MPKITPKPQVCWGRRHGSLPATRPLRWVRLGTAGSGQGWIASISSFVSLHGPRDVSELRIADPPPRVLLKSLRARQLSLLARKYPITAFPSGVSGLFWDVHRYGIGVEGKHGPAYVFNGKSSFFQAEQDICKVFSRHPPSGLSSLPSCV